MTKGDEQTKMDVGNAIEILSQRRFELKTPPHEGGTKLAIGDARRIWNSFILLTLIGLLYVAERMT